jgi:hypothetical protein
MLTHKNFCFPQVPRTTRLRDWPYYLDREQRALLRWIRNKWGEDCTIQIVGGRVRIVTDGGTLELCVGDLAGVNDGKSGVPERVVTESGAKAESP